MFEKLFEPVTINKMVVPNRLVFEPMGNYYAELNGDASQRDCDFYAARGAGGNPDRRDPRGTGRG